MRRRISLIFVVASIAATASVAHAQLRKVRVVTSDGLPIVHANVSLEGGATQITDEKGEVSLGAGGHHTFTASVRRIGYTPWFGKLELPDTAATITVTLPYAAQALGEVRVTGQKNPSSPFVQGFYDRWMMRQKGSLSATFIGPEELEFRHPSKITTMMYGLNGVQIRHATNGEAVLWSTGSNCQMAVVVDGHQIYPEVVQSRRMVPEKIVMIDRLLSANDVMAIEVYARGGNMPIGLQVNESACGVVAFWTGSRQP